MTETRVDVGGKKARWFDIRINGANPTFRIATDRIASRLVAPVDDLLLDLLDVAASVFAADSTVGRGGLTRADFGDGWRRKFHFTIAVRRPEVWSKPEVNEALRDAVGFLTDDEVSFAFKAGVSKAGQQQYLDFDPSGDAALQVDEVILFSGGLDSFSGALETLATTSHRVALVTHQSAQKMVGHQMRLAKALMKRFPGRILHIPVKAHRVGSSAKDTTQRSRSVLFAALGHVIARMLGARQISFFENGIVSHNLPISAQVIGSMATRTTHPLTLSRLQALLDSLGGTPIRIENRFAWLTKTEVVAKIAEHGGADSIKDAVSCTQVREQDTLHTHCGSCSQCLDRRFAMLAANLQDSDPAEIYQTDVMFGPRETDRMRTMVLDWTAHALRLADISLREFWDRHGGELARIAKGYSDDAPTEIIKKSLEMQQRHGRAVRAVLERVVAQSADRLVRGTLPDTSLLRMLLTQTSAISSLPVLVAHATRLNADGPELPAEIDSTASGIFPLQVAFSSKSGRDVIHILNLGRVEGMAASVVHELRPAYEMDIAEGRSVANHRYVPSGVIAGNKESKKDAVRKHVERCRRELANFYSAIEGTAPRDHLLVENKRQSGYRIDPTSKIIDPIHFK